MTIMWGAKRTRLEVLFTNTALATRIKEANKQDLHAINEVLKYINGCKGNGIRLQIKGKL